MIISEHGREWVFKIENFPVTLGRGANNTIVLADPKSSRQHCIIEKSEQGVVVRDLGSRNGTTVNGQKVEVSPLKEGDIIGIGDTLIFFGEKSSLPKEVEAEQRFLITIVDGENKGKEYPLVDLPLTIGRKGGNRIVLTDERVSGEHALITYEDGEYVLKDLNSRNGTYVEGRQILREVLTHGKRFRISTTVFEFSDRTKVPVEKEKGVVSEPSEMKSKEGELVDEGKVINLDAERAIKVKQPLLPTLLVGVMSLFIVVAIIYFAYVVVRTVVHRGLLPPPSNSLIVNNWSFEDVTEGGELPGWLVKGGSWSQDETRRRSGKRSLRLEINTQPEEDSRFEVVYKQRITVVPNTSYLLCGWIRTEDVRACGLGVRYRNSANPEFVKEELTQLLSGTVTNFSPVRGLFVPPPEADEMEIFCVAFGNTGTCWFDDIEMEKKKEIYAPLQTEGGYTLKYNSRAVVDFFLRGELILQDGRLLLYRRDEQPSLLLSQSTCRTLEVPAVSGDGVSFKGDIKGKTAGVWHRFSQKMKTLGDDVLLVYSFLSQLPDDLVVCYSFKIPEHIVSEGIVLMSPSGCKTVRKQFEEPVVNEMIIKRGSEDVVIKFKPPFAVSATHREGYFNVRCAVFAEDLQERKFSITLSPYSVTRKRGALQRLNNARTLFAKKNFSKALSLLRELSEEPLLKNYKDELAEMESSIKRITKKWLQTLKQMVEDISREPRLEYLLAIKSLSQKIKGAYPEGYNFDIAENMLEKARKLYEAYVDKKRVEKIEQLLQRAEGYKNRRYYGYAVMLYRYIKEKYPDTLWAKKASAELEILDKKRQE